MLIEGGILIYTTKKIADIVQVHPNTVRLYERMHYISPVKRGDNGYRIFTERHLSEMKLARLAFPGPYPVSSSTLFKMVDCFIHERFQEAFNFAEAYKKAVSEEIRKSRETLKILDRWYKGVYANEEIIAETRKAFAQITCISIDTIRTWERNGLFKPHVSENRRRFYNRFDFEKVQIIRLLRKQGFSIASLYELFNNADEKEPPSVFLEKIYKNTFTVCESDEWMNFLQAHLTRADQIIVFIKNRLNATPLTPGVKYTP